VAGHVFIVRGDMRRIACDAWLMPCSARGRGEKYLLPHTPVARWPELPADWVNGKLRTLRLDDWPAGKSQPWLVNVGGTQSTPIEWYVEGVAQFLQHACPDVKRRPRWFKRIKPLVAMNIVGTGKGGGKYRAGDIVAKLLPTLQKAVEEQDVDIALVAHDGPALAAAQAAREQFDPTRSWKELPGPLRAEADRLATRASRGELALFLGAGVSAGAGMPPWNDLLEQLAETAGMSEQERDGLKHLDVMDRAVIIENRLGSIPLQQELKKMFTAEHYALGHALLAALPVKEVVTTNYDCLFEMAWDTQGRIASVLPHGSRPDGDRWLLKMHGCVTRPAEIVLTREDYLGYAERRAALAGIVQALLITRHMLFVGFSLQDDNFHRIAAAVRRAVRTPDAKPPSHEPFGTGIFPARFILLRDWASRGTAGVPCGSLPWRG
jgi:hypothetical protein